MSGRLTSAEWSQLWRAAGNGVGRLGSAAEEFDRILAAREARAWDEGWEAGCNDQQYGDENAQPWTPNPHSDKHMDTDSNSDEPCMCGTGFTCLASHVQACTCPPGSPLHFDSEACQ